MLTHVTIGCPNCLQPITLEYDPGYAGSWDEPYQPPDWYSIDAHDCGRTGSVLWERIQEAAYNSPEYRAYEYVESLV